jgi:hypothetical protein
VPPLFELVLAVVFAIAGYQEARRFSRQYGRTPWGWDPLVWALVLGLSFLIGIVLLAIAERQGRAKGARPLSQANTPQAAWPAPGWPVPERVHHAATAGETPDLDQGSSAAQTPPPWTPPSGPDTTVLPRF